MQTNTQTTNQTTNANDKTSYTKGQKTKKQKKITIHTLSDVSIICPNIIFVVIHLQQQQKQHQEKTGSFYFITSSVYRSVEDNKANIESEIST